MTVTIPDLWPAEAVKVDVLTPAAILRVQAATLHQKTQNILRAEVIKTSGESDNITLSLEIIAPALNNYRERLLKVQFKKDDVYPVTVNASGLTVHETVTGILPLAASKVVTRKTESKKAYSDGDFIKIVQEVLQAPETIALLQSLIARSNDQEDGLETEVEEDEAAESAEE